MTAFLAYRFLPAAALVALLCRDELRRMPRAGWWAGLVTGGLLAAGNVFQATALERTSASTAGLITGLFVVLRRSWAGFCSGRRRVGAHGSPRRVRHGTCPALGRGEGTLLGSCLALLAALSFGGHILALGTFGRRYAPGPMATLQLAVCGILFSPWRRSPGPGHAARRRLLRAIAVTSMGYGAIAFLVQSWAQRRISPARAAVILAGEPAFAALTGWLIAGDRISLTGWVGAAIMLAAVFYVASRTTSDDPTHRSRPPERRARVAERPGHAHAALGVTVGTRRLDQVGAGALDRERARAHLLARLDGDGLRLPGEDRGIDGQCVRLRESPVGHHLVAGLQAHRGRRSPARSPRPRGIVRRELPWRSVRRARRAGRAHASRGPPARCRSWCSRSAPRGRAHHANPRTRA